MHVPAVKILVVKTDHLAERTVTGLDVPARDADKLIDSSWTSQATHPGNAIGSGSVYAKLKKAMCSYGLILQIGRAHV